MQPVRAPNELLTPFHMDIAASIQAVLEEIVLRMTRASQSRRARATYVSLAAWHSIVSPMAESCVMVRLKIFGFSLRPAMPAAQSGRRLPPSTSSTRAIRAEPNGSDGMHGSLLGPSSSKWILNDGSWQWARNFTVVSEDEMVEKVVEGSRGTAGGRLVPGPTWSLVHARSVPARSLGDPRSPTMQRNLNLKVKYRESFRPFAPSVLREDVAELV